jgi:hypothetical protein
LGLHGSWPRNLAVVGALLFAAPPAVGQVLRGTVLDSASGQPVSRAHVVVLVGAGAAVGTAVTAADGGFTFRLPSAGEYMIRISRIGHLTRITPPISVTSTVGASVEIRVSASPVTLDTLTVRAVSVPFERQIPFLVDAGFYERRRKGFGHFLTRAEIEKHDALFMTDALRGLSGVNIVCSTQRMVCDFFVPGARTMFLGKVCFPSVVRDGVVLRVGGTAGGTLVDDLLNPFNIEAVEVYPSPAGVPVQYAGYLSPCGVIIAWTRR